MPSAIGVEAVMQCMVRAFLSCCAWQPGWQPGSYQLVFIRSRLECLGAQLIAFTTWYPSPVIRQFSSCLWAQLSAYVCAGLKLLACRLAKLNHLGVYPLGLSVPRAKLSPCYSKATLGPSGLCCSDASGFSGSSPTHKDLFHMLTGKSQLQYCQSLWEASSFM